MTTRRIARQFTVAGYVRNLPDGQVELLVAGAADEIQRFLGAIATQMAGYVEDHNIQDEPFQQFDGFEIRT